MSLTMRSASLRVAIRASNAQHWRAVADIMGGGLAGEPAELRRAVWREVRRMRK